MFFAGPPPSRFAGARLVAAATSAGSQPPSRCDIARRYAERRVEPMFSTFTRRHHGVLFQCSDNYRCARHDAITSITRRVMMLLHAEDYIFGQVVGRLYFSAC